MKKLSIPLLVGLAAALSGCALYFGDSDSNDSEWNYCGADGYYVCEGDDCRWTGPECPAGAGSGAPGGFECTDDADCAAGCYCGDGICEEAGFCTQDSDCGEGFTCNESRSSCEPDNDSCVTDHDCPQGQYCSPDTYSCTATCVCSDDETALANGFGWCDESRQTCLPGEDPAGTCGGAPTCNTARPSCPSGQVPTIAQGCWTGECRPYGECDVNPVCENINDQTNCASRSDCGVTVNGINCKRPDGSACMAGDTGCTCDSYVFASCRTL